MTKHFVDEVFNYFVIYVTQHLIAYNVFHK